MAMLMVQSLTKAFDGLRVLDNLSFSLESGSINALIGPNGSGKTTTFNIITGFIRADHGEVYFKGRRITHLPPYMIAQMGVARTFQRIRLFPQITVLENMLLAMKYPRSESLIAALLKTKTRQYEEQVNRERALEWLDAVGLLNKQDALAQNLSHGQRRLLEIIRAMATNADLLLLDEPTAGVTLQTQEKLIELISMMKKAGKTILLIEHNMRFVMDIAEKIIVLNCGRKIEEGPPESIAKSEAVIDAYLGRRRNVA
jgi:branched-chain amino acid transport system ATP-binding protein